MQLRVLLFERHSARGRDDGETHHDIGGGELFSAQERTAVRGRVESLFEEFEVFGDIWQHEEIFHLGGDEARNGLEEEGHARGVFDGWMNSQYPINQSFKR